MNYIDNLLSNLEEQFSNLDFETAPAFLVKKGISNFLTENDFNPIFAEKIVSYIDTQIFVHLSSEQIDRVSKIFGNSILGLDKYVSKNIHSENREIFIINFVKKMSINIE